MLPKYDSDDYNDCLNLQDTLFKEVLSEWKRNVAPPVWSEKKGKFIPNTRSPVWKVCCTYVRKFVRGKLRTNYDLHYVNPVLSDGGSADVSFYVMKYMMKPSNRVTRLRQALHLNLPEDEYEDIWSLVRPRHFESEGLGLGQCLYDKQLVKLNHRIHYEVHPKVLEHLRSGIERSKSASDVSSPCFYSPVDGSQKPLARFYKEHSDIYKMSDFLDFFYSERNADPDNVIVHKDWSLNQRVSRIDDFEKKVNNVDFQSSALELDELFDSSDDDFLSIF